jgi:hypothetical protein
METIAERDGTTKGRNSIKMNEKIGDQVKEVMDYMFHCVTQQQEDMNRNMQEQMDHLHHMLEARRIMPTR